MARPQAGTAGLQGTPGIAGATVSTGVASDTDIDGAVTQQTLELVLTTPPPGSVAAGATFKPTASVEPTSAGDVGLYRVRAGVEEEGEGGVLQVAQDPERQLRRLHGLGDDRPGHAAQGGRRGGHRRGDRGPRWGDHGRRFHRRHQMTDGRRSARADPQYR